MIAFALAIVSCKPSLPEDHYRIVGAFDKIEDSTRIILQRLDDNNRPVSLDTTYVLKNAFSFEGKTPDLNLHFVSVDNKGQVPIFLEDGQIDMQIKADSIHLADISGTEQNDIFASFRKGSAEINNRIMQINNDFRVASQSKDTVTIKALQDEFKEIQSKQQNFMLDFVNNNPKSLIAGMMLGNLVQTQAINPGEAEDILNSMDKSIQEHAAVKRIADHLQKLKATEIGAKAPDFSGPTPDGRTISLAESKGKVTIIDFWAAWCKPCRMENPNVVRIYNQYKDKGLQIIGVSLDNKKEDWIKAIADDKLTWLHISNLAYFNDEIAKKYSVNAIPATFILDEKGNIVAKNLRGKELENKIAEMLN